MEVRREAGSLAIDGKVLTKLDAQVQEFVRVLESHARYVIVSGYVAILFGRSRGTEDVDVLIERMDAMRFHDLYLALTERGYHFLNPEDEQGLQGMLSEGLAIRAAPHDRIIPNFEMKFVKDDFDRYALKNRVEVDVDQMRVFISPLELQIPYKIWLGSDKDIEDAVYLWELFKDRLDKRIIGSMMEELDVDGRSHGIEL